MSKIEKEEPVVLNSKIILEVVKLFLKAFGLSIVFIAMIGSGIAVFFIGLEWPIDLIIGLTLIITGFIGFLVFTIIKLITKHSEKMKELEVQK